MFLLGRHAILGQEPPIYLRSTTATRLPSPANVHAAMVEPVPPPRITRSNSSGCDFLRAWADGEVSVLFMLFLSEQYVGYCTKTSVPRDGSVPRQSCSVAHLSLPSLRLSSNPRWWNTRLGYD